MKRILFVAERLQVNGAMKSLLALFKAISNDYDVSLFLFANDGDMMSEIPKNVRVLPELEEYRAVVGQMKRIVVESLKKGKFALAWFRLRIFLERALHRPFTQWDKLPEIKGDWDVVCAYADGLISSVVMNKVPNGKKVLWVHENYEDNPKPKEILDSFKMADAIVGVSKDAVTHLKNLLGASIKSKAFVVHNIVDPEAVRALSRQENVSLPSKGHDIVSVGRISPEKGYDMIPEILERLQLSGVDAHWSIIGGGLQGVEDSIMAEAGRRGVFERIHFLGEKQNPHPWTAAADCFVQLSRHEGWCMTITEALALGKPVVATDMPVFREQIVDAVNGFLAKDIDSFAVAIQRVLQGALPSKNNIESPCEPENVTREFANMVDSILADRS